MYILQAKRSRSYHAARLIRHGIYRQTISRILYCRRCARVRRTEAGGAATRQMNVTKIHFHMRACIDVCDDNDIIYCELPTSFFLYIFKFEAGWKKKTIIKKTGGADAPSFSWPNILFLRTVQCFEEEFLQTKQNTFCTNI